MINSLGESILGLLPTIPNGAVAFFPSYSYLELIASTWQKAPKPGQPSLWTRMHAAKPIFKESQAGPADTKTQDVLTAYTTAVTTSQKGALLLAVIGGRLSEGINFSDGLGRCVMVIGLPYPNPNSPEWKAKMRYIEQKAGSSKHRGGNSGVAAREYADNVCMRAVNQAIGRAVRHKGDWSAILLFDERYAQIRISDKLPGWIKASLGDGSKGRGFRDVEAGLAQFYARKKVEG